MAENGLYAASAPAVTTAPHPRDVARRLELRQNTAETCGWVSAESSSGVTCPVGNVCAYNTIYDAAFCCSAALYPYCGIIPTTCLDSTDVAARCTGACLYNDAVAKCVSPGRAYCATKVFSQSSVAGYVTGYDCSSAPLTETAYDYYIQDGTTFSNGLAPRSTAALSFTYTAPSSSASGSSSPSPSPNKKGGSSISGGAIAGIVIGVLAAIVIALAMFFFYRYMRKRQDHQHKTSQPPSQAQPQMSTGPTTSYVSGAPPTGPSSGPSSQHPFLPASPTPLTQQSLSQQNAMSEVSPADSASQVGGFYGSHVSQNNVEQQHAQFASGAGSAGTGPHSSLGALPEFQTQNPGLYGRQGPQSSVMSPGSAFDSLPGVRPPDVASAHPQQSPPLQQQQYAPPSSPPLPQQQQQGYPPQQQQQQQYAPPSSPPPQQQQGYPPQQQQYAPPSSPPPQPQQQQPQGYPQPQQQQPQGYPQPQQQQAQGYPQPQQQQPQGYPQPQQQQPPQGYPQPQYHPPSDGRAEMGS